MKAKIYISYKNGILDPQGETVSHALDAIGINNINSVRIGKYIEMDFDNISKKDVEILVDKSCKKLLVNPNTQTYTYEIKE